MLVGIAGGASSLKSDIWLGDVVVSMPGNRHGGVFQYDFGKTIRYKWFETTGYLDQPPRFLLTAVNRLMAKHAREGHGVEDQIDEVLKNNAKLRKTYSKPNSASDQLYKANMVHPCDPNGNQDGNSEDVSSQEPSNLVQQIMRGEDKESLVIHYDLIASENQVMKDATVRDALIEDEEVMCFEMEAAGLMNPFPCIAIQGICDYSDSRKNKAWQGYTVLAAAAYAADLLRRLSFHGDYYPTPGATTTELNGITELYSAPKPNTRTKIDTTARHRTATTYRTTTRYHTTTRHDAVDKIELSAHQQREERLNSLHFDPINDCQNEIEGAPTKTCQ